ncbi:MAG: choice-of-anchor D domain-containing protein [Bacteroidetes bacterium]|nr:choice-of-anchor D domain-containing protein [Bacteroidota bacterium]
MRQKYLFLLPVIFFLLLPAAPAAAQLFMEEVVVFAVDTTPKQSVFLTRDKNYDIICTGTYSFWRNAQNDSVGLADAAFYRDIPPGEFGFPGLSTSGTNGFLVNGQPISSRIVPPGPSATYTYRLPFIGLDAPLALFIEDHPPLSIDRHADNTGAIRVRIYNVSPEIAIDSAEIDFGEVELGAFRDTIVVFENVGYGALRLEEFGIGGADPGEFQYLGASDYILQPGERDSFTLRFTPTSVFVKNAFLEFTSTDSDSRVIRIPLRGTGVTTLEAGCVNTLRAQAQEQNLIPVTLFTNRDGSNTTSFRFDLEYDRSLLLPVGVETRGTLSASFNVTMTVTAPGRLTVTGTNGTPLVGTGTLVFLRAWAVWENPPVSPLLMHDLVFNAGNPRALMVDGSVTIDSICNQYLKNVSFTAPPILRQNHPNPFNPSTRITFTLAAPAQVRLDVFSLSGALVATLVQGTYDAGEHSTDFRASGLPTGLYLYRLQAGEHTLTRSMLLLR